METRLAKENIVWQDNRATIYRMTGGKWPYLFVEDGYARYMRASEAKAFFHTAAEAQARKALA